MTSGKRCSRLTWSSEIQATTMSARLHVIFSLLYVFCLPSSTSSPVVLIIMSVASQMLEKCPEDRLHITDIEEHPFFDDMYVPPYFLLATSIANPATSITSDWNLLETHAIPVPWTPSSDEPSFILPDDEDEAEFVPGRPFERDDDGDSDWGGCGSGPYPEFEWTREEDGDVDEIDLGVGKGETDNGGGEAVVGGESEVAAPQQQTCEIGKVGCELSVQEVIEPRTEQEDKQHNPGLLKAFFQRLSLWPWSKVSGSSSSTGTGPLRLRSEKPRMVLSTSTLHLPPTPLTPSCISTLSTSSEKSETSNDIVPVSDAYCPPPSSSLSPSQTFSLPGSAQMPARDPQPLIFRHVENGTGFLFKLRVWFKRLFPCTTTRRLSRFELLA